MYIYYNIPATTFNKHLIIKKVEIYVNNKPLVIIVYLKYLFRFHVMFNSVYIVFFEWKY